MQNQKSYSRFTKLPFRQQFHSLPGFFQWSSTTFCQCLASKSAFTRASSLWWCLSSLSSMAARLSLLSRTIEEQSKESFLTSCESRMVMWTGLSPIQQASCRNPLLVHDAHNKINKWLLRLENKPIPEYFVVISALVLWKSEVLFIVFKLIWLTLKMLFLYFGKQIKKWFIDSAMFIPL